MAHNKVYGFCESGCKVEVDPTGKVKPIEEGGTGATNAKTAREKLGAVSKTGDTMTGPLTIKNNDAANGECAFGLTATLDGFDNASDNGTYHFSMGIAEDGTGGIVHKSPDGEISSFSLSRDSTWFNKPLEPSTKAVGKQTLKNLGLEIQVGTAKVGTSGVPIVFPEAFSGVPVVTANGSAQTSIRITDITATGCTLHSGESGNNVNWQAVYISN